MNVVTTIVKENWEWRGQIFRLAVFELKKRARGAVLGWFWIIIKPIIFLTVFWFALDIGLRGGRADPNAAYPYFVWLASGIIPWFFMSDMLGTGFDVLHRYSYLVKKVKFPISGISFVYTLASLLVNLILLVGLLVIYTSYGLPWDIYMLQVPLLVVMMVLFWNMASIGFSQLSGMSKDFAHFMQAFKQPIFWLSGVIFSIDVLRGTAYEWVADLMMFNPVTFFVTAFRDATCKKVWFWDDPLLIGGFCVVVVLTFIMTCVAYSRFSEEVSDAL